MLQFVRSGPEFLTISSLNIDALKDYLVTEHLAQDFTDKMPEGQIDFSALDQKNPIEVIIFLVDDMTDASNKSSINTVYLCPSHITKLTIDLLNHDKNFVTRIRKSAKLLFMKTIGDMDKVVEAVAKDFNGEILEDKYLYTSKTDGALIHFTQESIDNYHSFSDVHPKSVYVPGVEREIGLTLTKRALNYVNIGISNQHWNDLSLRIYDSYSRYRLHYDRLIYILNKLDIALTAGEEWGTDSAFSFMSVNTYNVRIFTYLDPKKFKEIMLALEYTDDGERCADFDLYHGRKKISWSDLCGKEYRDYNRQEFGMLCREKLFDQVELKDQDFLLKKETALKEEEKVSHK